MAGFKGRKSSNKNPPIFSHEFVIQNHADIISCVTLVIVVGLMVQATSPIASMFLTVQHNVSVPEDASPDGFNPGVYFTNGWKDLCTIFFYFLVIIVVHAIYLEYILDKINRKLHLSKVRHSQFNHSGQLLLFYVISLLWGVDLILRENIVFNIASLWEGYPHQYMTLYYKFFFIVQLAYWLHSYPELYFQKVKREEIPSRIKLSSVNLALIGLAYLCNYNRIGLCLIVLHYLSETFNHLAIMIDLFKKDDDNTQIGHIVSNVVFVLVRLATIILSVLTFWYGLSLSENQGFDLPAGNFNTQVIRMGALVVIGVLQAWLMWNFITMQLARLREVSTSQSARAVKKNPKKADTPAQRRKEKKRDVSDLPEADQNQIKPRAAQNVRQRTNKVK